MDFLAELIGDSPGIKAVRAKVGRLLQRQPDSRRFPPILIQGETGTGKGLLARMIHRAGPRAHGPFVEVNCAAIPETLLEAELFGFERGAFTDARQAKAGLFQAAHRGTLFLDEVALLAEGLQAKLLNVIEERMVRRLGSTRSEPVDVWILAATNEDLAAATRERRFREDLYHRLAVLSLWLPPLRERPGDIVPLAEHFLARACADYELPPKAFGPDARVALQGYPWPGNVRELSNVIERVALLSEDSLVTAETLALPEGAAAGAGPAGAAAQAVSLEAAVGGAERIHLVEALRETGGNVTRAAARLGISRNTLRYRMDKHGLRPGAVPPRHPQRQARPALAPAASAPEAVPAPTGVRWEPRRLTLLRAALVVPPGLDSPLYSSRGVEVLVEKVQSFGGRVQELSPNGIVAAFGLDPVEDAPRRAAHAALAIRKAAERAPGPEGERLTVKVAIHVGQFLVGRASGTPQIDLEAKHEAWAMLDRLISAATADTIVVCEAAVPFLDRRFDLALMGAGGGEGRYVYRLGGRERPGLGYGRRMARFVGRRLDIDVLHSRLASAVRGHGQVIGIVGEAGIGKSRLLFEFRQSLAGEQATYLIGRCVSYGSAIPYLPVLDILRRNFRLAGSDPPEAIVDKVRAGLRGVGMDPENAAPYILHLLGVTAGTDRLDALSAEAVKTGTLETLREMILRGSRQRPIIFAVEDLHWIDKTSEEYVASLVESLHFAPILLLATYRPGYRPPWIDKSYATQVALQPLSPEDSLTVVRSILEPPPLPDDLARAILDKAEGNPFFLEELSRAVGEERGARTELTVPDTVQEVLLARIDRLPEGCRRVLVTASVLGREVSRGLLGRIWDGPGDLEAPLAELTRLEFLYPSSRADEPVYAFTHSLTQEVAYGSLEPERRQALHAAAGQALEAVYADRLEGAYGRLAYHYSNTGDAAKAVEYLSRFADSAARGYAHEEAVRALAEATSNAERLPAEARDRRMLDLVLRQAFSLFALGRFQKIADLLLCHQDRLERVEDPRLTGHYYFVLGHTCSFLGAHERAAASAQRAIEEARRCGDTPTMGKACCVLALEGALTGQAVQGLEHGRQAVALLERTDERWWLAQAHWLIGLNHLQIGEFESTLGAEARAQSLAEALGDPRLQSSVAWVTGAAHAAMGERDKGIAACRRSLECAPDPLHRAIAMGWLGVAYVLSEDPGQAIPLLEPAAQQIAEFGFRQFQAWFTIFLAEAYRASQRPGRALELARQGLDISREAKFLAGVGWAQQTLGRVAQARGAHAEAATHLRAALQTFRSVRSRYEVGRTHLDLAALAHSQGNLQAAAEHLGQAHELFRALRVTWYVERTERIARELGVPISG